MKIDLLYEMEVLKPWHQRSEYDCYWQALAQAELADRMGFDTFWEVEHHFLNEFAHSSAPEVFLSAVAMRTERIRIGHGVVLLPHPFNHPIRVAERAAVLDILSTGRLEFGTGRSSLYEQQGFGVKFEESRAMWQEALEVIPRMWTEDPFPAYDGKYFQIPERSILPKPIQKPHPPLWVAATSPESWQLAGQLGIGALGLTLFLTVAEVAAQIKTYHAAAGQQKPVGKAVNHQVGAFTIVHCAQSEAQARENGGHDAALWYMRYAFQVLAARGRDAQKIGPYEEFRKAHPIIAKVVDNTVTFDELDAEDMVIVGDPDKCIRKLEKYKAAGIDRVLCLMQAGRIPHPAVLQSIELFGTHVIPHISKC
jgi:alkanesulfonate monooxygenase SsuD/methylene tetrahydromethanopterin reductase-like flavin-dependent oxidoreductase (luciferase family)